MSDETDRVAVENEKPLATVATTTGESKSNSTAAITTPSNGSAATTLPVDHEKVEVINADGDVKSKKSQWVKFEEDEDKLADSTITTTLPQPEAAVEKPAVLTTKETVHVNLRNSPSQLPLSEPATISTNKPEVQTPQKGQPSAVAAVATPVASTQLRTIELSTGIVREGFANGDIIVTLLPINTKWPWITPAVFRPELVPEELMAQGLTLTVEEYVTAMETLVNDYRFTMYNICYKRVLVCWVVFAFAVLMGLLFSGLKGIGLFSLGVAWLFLNAAAIFLCMWVKLRLSRGLEHCLARVNKQLLRHKILLCLDDRGKISCHKVNLCFMYMNPNECVTHLDAYIDRSEQNGNTIEAGWESRLDVEAGDIVIQGSQTTRVSRKKERGTLLFLRYASRWGNEAVRGLVDTSIVEPARHCSATLCPCQFIERHLSCKPRGKSKPFNLLYWMLESDRYGRT